MFSGAEYKDVFPAKAYNRDVENFNVSDSGQIAVSELDVIDDEPFDGARQYSLTIDVASNLPLWAFFNGDELPNSDTLSDDDYYTVSDELYVILRNLQDHLEDDSVDEIISIFAERNRETDLAFYKKEGQAERELYSDFTNDIPTLNMI